MLDEIDYSIRKEESKSFKDSFVVILLKKKNGKLDDDYVEDRRFYVYTKDFLRKIADCKGDIPPEIVLMLEHITTLAYICFYKEEMKVEIDYDYRKYGPNKKYICIDYVPYDKLKSFFE